MGEQAPPGGVFRCQPIFHADNGLTRVVGDPLQHRILPHGGPRVRIRLPPAVSQVRTAIGPPELPVAPPKQAQPPSSTRGPRVRIHLTPARTLVPTSRRPSASPYAL